MTRTAIHPGEVLADELDDLDLSAAELARLIDVPANRISQILGGKRAISADTALRLGWYFNTSPELWMNLQKTYELDLARAEIGSELERLPKRPVADADR
ncbi:addiction module antidote protein, HigA family [Limimonas halophila]|uniref:Addiction module antidote protein, HigA family n=1 Tax=Limimonas halophila TaxID=1082479 RepID=A0A1G7LF88_9PROT|nr:HigA family addiction module antitoxin [Limimonas halophila]SDF48123.1 addiction module antidote protein, HigA family [Limimonas halophila]